MSGKHTAPPAAAAAKKRKKAKRKKKKKPVPIVARIKNVVVGQQHISRFHVLVKEREALEAGDLTVVANREKLDAVLTEMNKMGGLSTYQDASILGSKGPQHKFSAASFVMKTLREMKRVRDGHVLQLLDVGALTPDYKRHAKHIAATMIDLNSRDPAIEQADFLTWAPPHPYDVVVLSLVVNFVGTREKRGRMLLRAARVLRPGGVLVVVLPRPCVDNSRFMTRAHFQTVCTEACGVRLHLARVSAKLYFAVFTRPLDDGDGDGNGGDTLPLDAPPRKTFARKLLRKGAKRNNFSVVME